MSGKSCRGIERKILTLLHGHKTRTRLREIHAQFLRRGLHQFNPILSHFVSVCASQNQMPYANCVFSQTHHPNIFLFNAMIKGFSLCKPYENSLLLFSSMKGRGIWPDEYTFAPLLKACSSLSDLRLGQSVHREVIVVGFERFSALRIGLVELYSVFGEMEDAKTVFDEMCERDVIVWNLMIRGWFKRGNVDMGLCLFKEMGERSVVSWNTVISCLAQVRRDVDALGLFQEMLDQGFEPDEATVVTVLPICARLGDFNVGKWIQSFAESSGLYRDFVSVGNALVDFYCKCGMMETARRVFNKMPQKNVVSWNAMISGLAFNGNGVLGVQFFQEMLNQEVTPNDTTFVGVLSCCVHGGLVEKGRDLFASMTRNHQIEPKLEHHGCMVDLLGRSGHVKEAYELIKSMPERPNAALWGSLVSACRTHGDLEMALLAAKELIDLEPWNSGNYVVLSNIYAEEKRWDEVEKVRDMMRIRSVTKAPGQSAIV